MNAKNIEKIIENKYTLLLISLVLLMVASPVVSDHHVISFFIESFLFVAVIAITLWISGTGKVFFFTAVSFAVIAMVFHYPAFVFDSKYMGLVALFTYLLYIGAAIIFMLRKIFSEKRITADTVKGSISVYLLIGIWWQILYTTIWVFDQSSFALQDSRVNSPDFFYFSFTTMTTLGYGDIIAKSHAAKTVAMLQAITGQMYIAILVARLVGLHIAHSQRKD